MKVRESLRRADWLRELHGLLFVGVVLTALVGVVSAIATLTGQPFSVGLLAEEVLRPDAVVNVADGVHADPNTTVYLRITQPTGAQLALATAATLPTYALTTTMLVMLWRLVGAARRTDPFTWATVRRLRALGWLLVIGGPVAWVVEFGARFALSDTVTSRGPHATLDLFAPAVWGLVGFGMLAIGEVIRRGQALRTELDGVV
jgi:hypothetical protein